MSSPLADLFRTSPLFVLLTYYLYVFGVITVAGGIVGFVKAKSRASIVAGTISGALLVLAAWLVGRGSHPGLLLGLGVSAALAARFGMAFMKTRKVMPAALIAVLGVVGVALSVAGLATFRG